MSDLPQIARLRYSGDVRLGELLVIAGFVGTVMFYYFGGLADLSNKINSVERADSERISRTETRLAVIEQHQVQTDGVIVEIRSELGKISDKIDALRPLIVDHDGHH
jgi:hypothetical protein